MSKFEVVMPKMGESVEEATITKWFIKPGDTVEEDDVLLEIATDKVDSEIPSPVSGIIKEVFFKENDVVAVGKVIAIIDMSGESTAETREEEVIQKEVLKRDENPEIEEPGKENLDKSRASRGDSTRFYSPVVRSIATRENLSNDELENIRGTGHEGRVRKQDVLDYLEKRKQGKAEPVQEPVPAPGKVSEKPTVQPSVSAGDEIREMDRMRKLIADHMLKSVQTSPHVTSMVEADVTELVQWRNQMKDDFQDKEKIKLTYMPVFIEAVAKALRDFPQVNSSTDGKNIIFKRDINIGIAVALSDGNLIVPVIKKADQLSLIGIAHELARLATAARNNKLKPDEIQGGTFSITNFGTFRNVMGTPIINQPQVAILATGSIEKKPAVLETPAGDVIAIRHKMFLSLSYDHRIVDGALGGSFVRRIADYLEDFDKNRKL